MIRMLRSAVVKLRTILEASVTFSVARRIIVLWSWSVMEPFVSGLHDLRGRLEEMQLDHSLFLELILMLERTRAWSLLVSGGNLDVRKNYSLVTCQSVQRTFSVKSGNN